MASQSVMICENIVTAPPRPNGDGAFNHKIEYVTIFSEILNPEGHPNCITGSKVTSILLHGWILPVGGASPGRVFACSLRSILVFTRASFLHRCRKEADTDRFKLTDKNKHVLAQPKAGHRRRQ